MDFKKYGKKKFDIEYLNFFEYSEGLPKGIILPEDCIEAEADQQLSDEEDYFSAEEETVEIRTPGLFKDAATQTDPIREDSACLIM